MTFFEKADVNGAKAREVYSFLKPKLLNDDDTTDVRWNFAKFLVDHEGTPFRRYATGVAPDDMRPDIEALLKKKEESSQKKVFDSRATIFMKGEEQTRE